MTRAYLSGPIIHADLRKEEFYREVVRHLESKGIDVFAPQFLHSVDPVEIYERDVHKLSEADFLIGEVSNPSLGVGMELMLSIMITKPILLFRFHRAKSLSRMVVGAPGKALFDYTSIDDVLGIIESMNLSSLVIHACENCDSMVSSTHDGILFCVKCRTQADT